MITNKFYFLVFANGSLMILEPIMYVEITVPTEFRGEVLRQITKRQGIILSNESNDEDWASLACEVPLNDMFGYAGHLRSITQVTISVPMSGFNT